MLLMVFVNNFWTVKGVPHALMHGGTREDFMGLADYVFPCFLFVVGLSIPYALEKRLAKGESGTSTIFHILGRTLALWVMGVFLVNTEYGISRSVGMSMSWYKILMTVGFFLVWNSYPKDVSKTKKWIFRGLQILGVALLAYLSIIFRDEREGLFQLRWWGILGSIGWTYLFCAFTYLAFRSKIWKHAVLWVLFAIFSMVSASQLIPREFFLQSFMDMLHLVPGTKICFCTAGILVSLVTLKVTGWKSYSKLLLAAGSLVFLVAAGWVAHKFWIVSKNLATPPTLFYCTAASIALYCVIHFLVSKGKAGWFGIIRAAGTATLTCYMVPTVVNSALRLMHLGPEMNLSGALGLAKCALFAFVCVWITALLEKAHVKLKI